MSQSAMFADGQLLTLMMKIELDEKWPESWKYSYPYDRMELYGETTHRGYAYAYDARRRNTLDLVQRVASPGARILDVAAAQGNFSLALAELGYEVTWNDLREDLVGYVKLKHERGKIAYAPGDVFGLQFGAEFEVVLITEIIEHVAHPDRFLGQIAQFVKPGGHIVMTTPNGRYFRNPLPKFSECADPAIFESKQFQPNADGHIFLLHPDEIEPLAQQANLSVEEIRLFTNPLTNGHLKTEALLKITPRGLVNSFETATAKLPWGMRQRLSAGMAVLFARQPTATAKSRE